MSSVVHFAEPSRWVSEVIRGENPGSLTVLAPWALPSLASQYAPSAIKRFASRRANDYGKSLPGFTALELAARLYSRGRRDRIFRSQFALRKLASIWAAQTRDVRRANRIYAPSLSARRLFAGNEDAEKILVLDLPILRVMHEDLDFAASTHPDCGFLNRYRAPAWAVVEQECEFAMADRIIVRGRFAQQELSRIGVRRGQISITSLPIQAVEPCRERVRGQLRVMLAGLAAARHGAAEVLSVLQSRPWLHVVLRPGEGSEPKALLEHPRVSVAHTNTLSEVDAVIAPSLCEAYLREVHIAAESGIPVIATMRGAGAVPSKDLTIELPSQVERGLACAIDALYGAEPSQHFSPSLVTAALGN